MRGAHLSISPDLERSSKPIQYRTHLRVSPSAWSQAKTPRFSCSASQTRWQWEREKPILPYLHAQTPPPVPSSKEIVYRRSSQPPRAPIPVHVFTGNGIVPEPVRIMTKSPGKSNTTISAWQHSRIIDDLRQGEIGVRASLLACGGGGYKRGWKGVGGHEVV